jgi:hypothetical protein
MGGERGVFDGTGLRFIGETHPTPFLMAKLVISVS